jgi:hypothetical protein
MPGTVSMAGTESRTGALSAQAEGLGSYASLGLLLAVGVLFFVVAMTANRLLRTTSPRTYKRVSPAAPRALPATLRRSTSPP